MKIQSVYHNKISTQSVPANAGVPCVRRLQNFRKKAAEFKDVVKIGRTHLMDA